MREALFSRRLLGEGAWALLGQAGSALAALAAVRLLTELLTPAEFGRLTLLVGLVALAVGLAATPTLQAVIRLYPDALRRGELGVLRRAARERTGRFVAAFAGLVAIAWAVVAPSFDDTRLTGLLIAASIVVDALRLFELACFNAARRQRAAAIVQAADASARPALALLAMLLFGPNAEAALLGYVAGSALVVIALRTTTRLGGVGDPSGEIGAVHRLGAQIARYARPLAPLALLGWVSGLADRYLVGGLLGLGAAGTYAAASGLVSRPFLMFGTIVELTLRPVLHDALAAGDAARATRIRQTWLTVTGLGSLAGALLVWMLGPVIAALLLAEPYREAALIVMPWLALGWAIRNLATVHTRFCYAYDDTRAVFVLHAAGAAAALLVLGPAILVGGLAGAAMALPVSAALELGFAVILARRAERAFGWPVWRGEPA